MKLLKILLLSASCLLAAACDKVKDQPAPDPLQGLELKPLQLELRSNQTVRVPLLENQPVNSQITLQITRQPRYGTLSLNTLFEYEYTPNAGFSGTDSFEYRICSPQSCVDGQVLVTIQNTDPPCKPVVSDTTLLISGGIIQELSLPQTYGCGSGISAILSPNPARLFFENGRVKANFPANRVDTLDFQLVSCAETRCDTGNIRVIAGLEPCRGRFQANADSIQFKSFVASRHFSIPDLLNNDSACLSDLDPRSFEIVGQASTGSVIIKPRNAQGWFFEFKRNQPLQNIPDSFTYRIKSYSGAQSVATVFIKVIP